MLVQNPLPHADNTAVLGGGTSVQGARTVHDLIVRQATAHPHQPAIKDQDRIIHWGQLEDLSTRLACHLTDLGVTRGDIVGLMVPRGAETIIAMIATLKAGAAYCPIDPAYPKDHIRYVLGEIAPKVVFVQGTSSSVHVESIPAGVAVRDLGKTLAQVATTAARPAPVSGVRGDDAAYVMFTSGSTGRPKGVVIPHIGIVNNFCDQSYIDIGPGDVMLHASTISFDASALEIWAALLGGASIAVMPDTRFSISDLGQRVRDFAVTHMLLTSGLFNLFCDHAGADVPALRQVLFGGDVGSPEHVRRLLAKRPDLTLTNIYGPTEGTCLATAFTVPAGFDGQALPIGSAIRRVGVHILDDTLTEVPAGQSGQIAISGPGVAIKYLNAPEMSAQKFCTINARSGRIRAYLTGDYGLMDAAGSLSFKGRQDRQIKLDGKRIELDEIETALRADPALADAIVMCQTQGDLKRIVGYLKPKPATDAPADLPDQVSKRLRDRLRPYMIPSAFVVMDEFPLNNSGKVDRSKFVPPAAPVVRAFSDQTAEGGSAALVRQLWTEVLGAQAPMEGNFFDLGGTSLSLMRVHAGLEKALGRQIDVTALFSHPTLRELADYLDGKSGAPQSTQSAADRAARNRQAMARRRRSL